MNRTLTAAVALVAGLGMAGLAHAKSSAGHIRRHGEAYRFAFRD